MDTSFENMALEFREGMLLFPGSMKQLDELADYFAWDTRLKQWRATARDYRYIMLRRADLKLQFADQARKYEQLSLRLHRIVVPRPHQKEALSAWVRAGKHGVVSLPTGAGKTILAVLAMVEVLRPTLIVVPTLDLLHQWQKILREFFEVEIGVLGGGQRIVLPITVATYDTAAMMIASIGDQFGFLICDECHHLPAPQYQFIAAASIAPFRLGLSATVERADGKEDQIFDLLGPLVYQGAISEMVDKVLSPYDVVTVEIPLTAEESQAYTKAREVYIGFIRRHGINMSSQGGWGEFLRKASFMPGGKQALEAHRLQKRLAQGAHGKVKYLWDLLRRHSSDRVIVFTDDNELAYRIGRAMILPVLTHKTKNKERKRFLEEFKSGSLKVLVTSKVLNEGVDVPEASIAVVVSGSAGVREHVQRLGRILRHQPGKRAILYELISERTSETFVKQRRRQHSAYQRPS